MRIRSLICAFLFFVLLCVPFQAGADTLDLRNSDLKVINSLAFAGLKKDLVIFPDNIEYIADDAFLDAEFVGSGKSGSYAYHWCVNHGFAWAPTETTQGGRLLDTEVNYSGRTIWQRFVQKYYLKATVRNNKTSAAAFDANKVKYNIRMTFHIDEVFNRGGNTVTQSEIKQTANSITMTVSTGVTPINPQTRLNSIRILLKGWNGPDDEDNNFQSFQKDTEGYVEVYRADWLKNGAYNYNEPEEVNVYDEEGHLIDPHEHLDLRPQVWDGAVLTINTSNHMLSVYHPGDLEKNYYTYNLMDAYNAGYLQLSASTKNLIIDPRTNQPYKKLRVKITASFNDTCRIAFHESVIDNVFVNVVDKD